MPIDQELLEISFEALANHKKDIDKAKEELVGTKQVITEVKDSLSSDIGKLSEKVSTITAEIPSIVSTEISKIPIPKDGVDGMDGTSITIKDVEPLLKEHVSKVQSELKANLDKAIKSIPKPKAAKPGPKGDTGKQGPVGKTGKQGKDGKSIKGKDGQDGVGIKEVRGSASAITIELTNGQEKTIKLPKTKVHTQGVMPQAPSSTPAGNSYLNGIIDVDTTGSSNGDVLTYNGEEWVAATPSGAVADVSNFKKRTEIESMFKEAETTAYKELTYTNGSITAVDIYTTSEKSVKLFSKIIGYNNGNISTIAITDVVNGGTLNKTLEYSGSDLSSITSSYTA